MLSTEGFFLLHELFLVFLFGFFAFLRFLIEQTLLDERVSNIICISGFGETQKGYNFRCHVVKLSLARLNRLLAEQLLVMLRHEVETTSLHQHVLALELALLVESVESVLLALAGHRIGALSGTSAHDIKSLCQGGARG